MSLQGMVLIIGMIIIIAEAFFIFKERILRLYYGERRKRVLWIDERYSEWVTLWPDLKGFTNEYGTFTWNKQKEKYNACVFNSTNAEPLEVDFDITKTKYWCDSNEYHTVLGNKLLELLMMLKVKDQIIFLLIIVLIFVVLSGALSYIQGSSINEQIQLVKNNTEVLRRIAGE